MNILYKEDFRYVFLEDVMQQKRRPKKFFNLFNSPLYIDIFLCYSMYRKF